MNFDITREQVYTLIANEARQLANRAETLANPNRFCNPHIPRDLRRLRAYERLMGLLDFVRTQIDAEPAAPDDWWEAQKGAAGGQEQNSSETEASAASLASEAENHAN